MIKKINPLHTINTLQQFDKYPTIDQISKITPIKPIYKKPVQKQTEQASSNIADYNDSLEINSLADALTNVDAKIAKYGEWVRWMPITSTIVASLDHAFTHQIKPIFQGDFKAAALNTLTDLGETADFFAQPFKALTTGGIDEYEQNLKHGGAAGTAGFLGGTIGGIAGSFIPVIGTAIGATIGGSIGAVTGAAFQGYFADSHDLQGRKNYDYDTGSLAADMALEVVSDPLNWFTLAKAPFSATRKGTLHTISKTAKQQAVDALEQAGIKIVKKQKDALAGEVSEQLLKKVYKNTTTQIRNSLKEKTALEFYEALSDPDNPITLGSIAKHINDQYGKIELLDPKTRAEFAELISKALFSEEALRALGTVQLSDMACINPTKFKLIRATNTILDSLDNIADGVSYEKKVYTLSEALKINAHKVKNIPEAVKALFDKEATPEVIRQILAKGYTPNAANFIRTKTARIGGLDRTFNKMAIMSVIGTNPCGFISDLALSEFIRNGVTQAAFNNILYKFAINHMLDSDGFAKTRGIQKAINMITENKTVLYSTDMAYDTFSSEFVLQFIKSNIAKYAYDIDKITKLLYEDNIDAYLTEMKAFITHTLQVENITDVDLDEAYMAITNYVINDIDSEHLRHKLINEVYDNLKTATTIVKYRDLKDLGYYKHEYSIYSGQYESNKAQLANITNQLDSIENRIKQFEDKIEDSRLAQLNQRQIKETDKLTLDERMNQVIRRLNEGKLDPFELQELRKEVIEVSEDYERLRKKYERKQGVIYKTKQKYKKAYEQKLNKYNNAVSELTQLQKQEQINSKELISKLKQELNSLTNSKADIDRKNEIQKTIRAIKQNNKTVHQRITTLENTIKVSKQECDALAAQLQDYTTQHAKEYQRYSFFHNLILDKNELLAELYYDLDSLNQGRHALTHPSVSHYNPEVLDIAETQSDTLDLLNRLNDMFESAVKEEQEYLELLTEQQRLMVTQTILKDNIRKQYQHLYYVQKRIEVLQEQAKLIEGDPLSKIKVIKTAKKQIMKNGRLVEQITYTTRPLSDLRMSSKTAQTYLDLAEKEDLIEVRDVIENFLNIIQEYDNPVDFLQHYKFGSTYSRTSFESLLDDLQELHSKITSALDEIEYNQKVADGTIAKDLNRTAKETTVLYKHGNELLKSLSDFTKASVEVNQKIKHNGVYLEIYNFLKDPEGFAKVLNARIKQADSSATDLDLREILKGQLISLLHPIARQDTDWLATLFVNIIDKVGTRTLTKDNAITLIKLIQTNKIPLDKLQTHLSKHYGLIDKPLNAGDTQLDMFSQPIQYIFNALHLPWVTNDKDFINYLKDLLNNIETLDVDATIADFRKTITPVFETVDGSLEADVLYSLLNKVSVKPPAFETELDIQHNNIVSLHYDESIVTTEFLKIADNIIKEYNDPKSPLHILLNNLTNKNLKLNADQEGLAETAKRLVLKLKTARELQILQRNITKIGFDTTSLPEGYGSTDLLQIVWSQMQRLYKQNVKAVLKAATVHSLDVQTELFKNINTALITGYVDRHIRVTDLLDVYKTEIGEAFFEQMQKESLHTAITDAKATYAILHVQAEKMEKELGDKSLKKLLESNKVFVYDLETTSAKHNSAVVEMAIVDPVDTANSFHEFAKLTQIEIDSFTDDYITNILKYDSSKYGRLTPESYDKFVKETYNKDTIDRNVLFTKLSLYLKEHPDIVLAGHNIYNFDNEVLIKGIKDLNPNDCPFKNDLIKQFGLRSNDKLLANSIDTLHNEYALRHIYQLTTKNKQDIYEAVIRYANNLDALGVTKMISTNPYGIAHDLKDILKELEQGASKNKLVDSGITTESIVNVIDKIKGQIDNLEDSIATYSNKENRYAAQYAIPTSYSTTEFLNGQAAVTDFSVSYSFEGKQFTNLPAVLSYLGRIRNNVSDISYAMTNILTKEVSNYFDTDTLLELFKEDWSPARIRKLQKAARYIRDTADSYNHVAFLNTPEMKEMLQKVLKFLKRPESPSNYTWKTYFKDIDDPISLMATIQYLYTGPVRQEFSEFLAFYNTNKFNLVTGQLHYPSKYKDYADYAEALDTVIGVIERKECYLGHFVPIENDNPALKYIDVLKQLQGACADADEILESLAKEAEITGITRTNNQRLLSRIARLEQFKRDLQDLLTYLKEAKSYDPTDPTSKRIFNKLYELNIQQQQIYNRNALQELHEFLQLDDNQLISYYLQNNRFVILSKADLTDTEYKTFINHLNNIGYFKVIEKDNYIYTVLDNTYTTSFDRVSGKFYNLEHVKFSKVLWATTDDDEYNHLLQNAIRSATDLLDSDPGEFLHPIKTSEKLQELYEKLPEEVRALLPPIEDLHNPMYYNWDTASPLGNVLGSYKTLSNIHGERISVDAPSRIYNAFIDSLQMERTKVTLESLLDNPTTGMSWGKNASNMFGIPFDKETQMSLSSFLNRHEEYSLITKVYDKHGRAKVIKLPNNAKVMQKYYDAGYTISVQTRYSSAALMDTLNYKSNNSFLRIAKIVIKWLKVGYLSTFGMVFRNITDSYMKNAIDLGTTDAGINTIKAMQVYNQWNKCYQDIMKICCSRDAIQGKDWLTKAAATYFKDFGDTTDLTLESFLDLLDFFENGPSSAMLKDLELTKRYGKTYNLITQNMDEVDDIKTFYTKAQKRTPKTVLDGLDALSNRALLAVTTPTRYVERINRLAMFMTYSERGYLTKSQIYERIAKVHFDFSYKSELDRMLELVIPFYSFTKDNISFWLELFNTRPQLFGNIINALTPAWNLDEQDPEELAANRSLQNQILSGQLVINAKSNLTIKLNPSFLDVLTLFTNPVEAIEQRLLSPLQQTLQLREGFEKDYKDILNTIPLVGAVNVRAEMIQRNMERLNKNKEITETQRLAAKPFAAVSSLFGVTARYQTYEYLGNKYYKNSTPDYYNNYSGQKERTSRPTKIYFPMDSPKSYSSSYYRVLYVKSLQRYFNR